MLVYYDQGNHLTKVNAKNTTTPHCKVKKYNTTYILQNLNRNKKLYIKNQVKGR